MVSALSQSDHDDIWSAVQEVLKSRMTAPSFETWISPLVIAEVRDDTVCLKTESTFKRDWVVRHYRDDLQNAFCAVLGTETCDLRVVVADRSEIETALPDPASADARRNENVARSERPWTPRTTRSNLNPKYTFENFVVGQHNQFCHAAALAVAENPAQSYNPFFIHGGVGLGKTHLIQAIGHFILAHNSDVKVKYVTSEQFTNELIHALSKKEWTPFRDRYRKIDVLIIDDIQFLGGKDRTQQELFHTFNTLHESGKQIILSSDSPPKHLADLEDRLRSRFEWGLIADIQPPDVETRLAILQHKAKLDNIELPPDVLAFIAEAHPHNIRELEGALKKVSAYAMLTHTPVSLPVAQRVLGYQGDPKRISLDRIIEVVAQYYHLRPTDLKSTSRAKDISFARQVTVYMLRTLTDASFPKIGQVLGGRKHTTVLYAHEKIVGELDAHPVLSQQIREITARIKAL